MKLSFTLALLLPSLAGFAQTLTNDGGTLTVEAGATLYVEGGLQSKATSIFTNAGTLQLTGDLTNEGTLTSSGQLQFTGATNQVFQPGSAVVSNLILNNTGATGQRTLSIPTDLTLTGQLTLLSGMVRTAPLGATTPLATLTLADGASVVGEAAGRYVQGNLRVLRAAVNSSTGSVDFSNGLVLNPNGQSLGAVTVTRTAGLQAAGVSYGQNLEATQKGIDRVWAVAATQPAQPVAVTLSWVSDDDNGFDTSLPGQLWRAATAAGPWVRQGAAASASNRSFTAAVTQLGTLTVSNSNAPLPVELTNFTAEPRADDALLRWTTASEKDNDRFEVEASADGQTFRRIGTVAGHGTTAQPQQYQLVDKGISRYATDLVYYRLRQVDRNGTASLSPVRTVRVLGLVGFAVQFYPNPLHTGETPTLLVRTALAGPVQWQLTDALGRTIFSRTGSLPVGTSPLSLLPTKDLAMGVYLVRVQQGKQSQTLKLIRE
ncbi:T9SS type A sorting domain-containing protein [Hymenobacter guriensis]|uniref:T9SS type A sorting domain-containing protein n=1 Tax=Hymenobacter guriensis TaxID=2793065 RepID=A0ABS0L5L5_9BACT|nr:T9SS type A sorting domain-containing protein [Hymenobacter guriensis]MBG8555408.1 T9SS type A sorting domain-containing protein [Hymenobacter guriensis]